MPEEGCWRRTFAFAVRPAVKEGEELREEHLKYLVIPCVLLGMVFYSLGIILGAATGRMTLVIPTAIWLFAAVCFLAHLYTTKRLTETTTGVIMFLWSVYGGVFMDLNTAGNIDAWTGLVIIMDIFLLANYEGPLVRATQGLTIAYLLLKSVESAEGIGIYKVFSESSCNECPVSWSVAAVQWMFRSGVFLVDFALTRRFAVGMREQQAVMESAISTAEHIAASLCRFDLTTAENTLRGATIGEGMHSALSQLLRNLHAYRPFLPDALLTEATEVNLTSISPPGATEGPCEVAIVFTDIQSSSALWETMPEAMKQALDIHNETLRRAMVTSDGYEVKTLGDAFMIAFSSCRNAQDFCFSSQRELLKQDWPDELLHFPLCAPAGVWRGLRVRMGIHFGEATLRINPVTSRADYFGHTVNIAARVQGEAEGGIVLATQSVADRVDHCSVRDYGLRHLRGIGEEQHLFAILPDELQARFDLLSESMDLALCKHTSSLMSMSLTSNADMESIVGVRTSLATTAHVWAAGQTGPLHDPLQPIHEVVSLVVDATDRTQGTLSIVGATDVVVTWNTSRPCASHEVQGLRFATLLHRAPRCVEMHVGLSTSTITSGSVGPKHRRHVVYSGKCVEVAMLLAQGARRLETWCLIEGGPGPYNTHVRPVDRWLVEGKDILVCEVRVAQHDDLWMLEGVSTWGWSEKYWVAFLSADPDEISRNCPTDKVALKVASMLRSNTTCMMR